MKAEKIFDLTCSVKQNEDFISLINRESGQEVQRCYQCGKCTAGCPLSRFMDISPNQVIRMTQLGLKEEVLNCQSIWLCSYCSTCTVRCPCGVHLAEVMDALRIVAQREGIHPQGRAKKISLFNENFLKSLQKFGRLNEFSTMLNYNIQSGKLFNQAETGLSMLSKGKLKLGIPVLKGLDEVKRVFAKSEELEEKS